jgi:uncharacterized protein YndB with AHSA1/START domain
MIAPSSFCLTVTRDLAATPAEILAALTDIATAPRIWFATPEGRMERAEIDPREGGSFRFDERRGEVLAHHWGTFSAVSPGRIAFAFQTDKAEPPSRVGVTLDEQASGTRLTLSHDLAETWRPREARIAAGWEAILGNLEAVLAEAPRRLALTRHFPCPVSLLWSAWTDPDRLPRWWGPRGFTCETREIRLGQGGLWRFDMIGPDGTRYPNRHRYTRVDPETRIDYRLDDDGRGEHAFDASVRFHAEGEGSRLTLTMVTDTQEHRDMMVEFGAIEFGYTTLDCLAEEALGASGAHAVSLTRSYTAPPARLWAAWTDPDTLTRWFAPEDCTLAEARVEPRPGGRFEGLLASRTGGERTPFAGHYRALEAPRRLAFSYRQGEDPAPETEIEVTLSPTDTGTRLVFLQRGLPGAATAAAWGQALARLADATA